MVKTPDLHAVSRFTLYFFHVNTPGVHKESWNWKNGEPENWVVAFIGVLEGL